MKQKLLNSIRLRIALLVALLCSLGTGSVWGAENDTHDFSQSLSQLLNNNASISSINIAAQSYPVKKVTVSYRYNKTIENAVTVEVTVAGTSWGTKNVVGTGSNYTTLDFTGDAERGAIVISFTNNTGSGTGHGTFYVDNVQLVEGAAAVTATALSVGTAPTKTEYRVGEKIDFTGLVLNATVGGEATDVTSGYTAKIGETSVTSGTTVLSEVGKKTVTFTYGGQTATQDIYVGELKGIAITTAPSKVAYDEGQSFNSAGMVVTATYTDSEITEHTWTQAVALSDGESDGYTYSPTSALTTSNTSITVSYTWNKVEKTANQDITVTAGVPYTVTFDAGSGSCATASLDEASFGAGVTLPTATIGITGWSFAGWATSSTTNTEIEPTLYAAGATYNPTENTILYAVYKFTEGTEGEYKRATSVSEITTAGKVVIVSNKYSKMLDNTLAGSIAAPSETESKITAAAKDVFTVTGNSTDGYTLQNSSLTIGVTGTSDNTVLSNTSTNSTWTINTNSATTNAFYFENKAKSKLCLEHNGTNWCVYAPGTPSTNAYCCLKVYIPDWATTYNSNPAAIINPTIAWTTAGDKTLYLQNTNTYDNAANVTGIAKTPAYTSSDATVATVSEAGVVTALKAGSATITAKVAKEVGVNTEASVTYVVTVKDASNIAGLKEVATSSSATAFTADLTDAVVTYVNGSYAYIEDASGAVYASCGSSSSLTAGKKISGAVSGSVKVANQIDEITAIDLSRASVTDGVIPSAIVQTTAQVVANKATLEGKLVSVTGAKVTASLTSGNASGGKIKTGTDDEINLYAPASNIDALKDAEGTFNGYISLYNGGLRFNIYEQSQITLTKNAPIAQTLTFERDAVELDEETSAYSAFTGQAVSGAKGTVTYSVVSDDNGVVTSISASTGAVVLSGEYGTATIKASAAAKEMTEAGVTTPYTATEKTYTVTVYPRYTVTFSDNGIEDARRQDTHGAPVSVPTPSDKLGYKFMGWSEGEVDLTDVAPSMASLSSTITPEANATYYAVYASVKTPATNGTYTLKYGVDEFTPGGYGADVNVTANDGSSWVVRAYDNSGMQINSSKDASIKLPTCPYNIKTIVVTCSSNNNFSFGTTHKGSAVATPTNNTIDLTSGSYTTGYINPSSGANVITKIVVNYGSPATYGNYRTSISEVPVTITSAEWATIYTPYALDFSSFSSNFKAYTASLDESTVTLTEVETVPANTGVVINGTPGTYNVPVITSSSTAQGDLTGNASAATAYNAFSGYDIYMLAINNESGKAQFTKVNAGSVAAGKAYLKVGSGVGVKAFNVVFAGNEETAITETAEKTEATEGLFDLSGRRLNKAQKGLYILNGRKVLVK